jgi:hypothetical protein
METDQPTTDMPVTGGSEPAIYACEQDGKWYLFINGVRHPGRVVKHDDGTIDVGIARSEAEHSVRSARDN